MQLIQAGERETEAKSWIESVFEEEIFEGESFQEELKDGLILCHLFNKITEELSLKKLNPSTSRLGFKQMENIHQFLVAIEELGVRPFESFQTVDLFEAKNMNQVVDCIFAVSRCAAKKGYNGPRLGPKMATANVRNFTQDQLDAGKNAVPLLKGFNKGASQKGMTFGGKRQIGGVYEGGNAKNVEIDTSSMKGLEYFRKPTADLDVDASIIAPAAESSLDLLEMIDKEIESINQQLTGI